MFSFGKEFFSTFISSLVIVLSALTLNAESKEIQQCICLNYMIRGRKAMVVHNKNNNNHNLWRAFLTYQAPE